MKTEEQIIKELEHCKSRKKFGSYGIKRENQTQIGVLSWVLNKPSHFGLKSKNKTADTNIKGEEK